MAEMSRLFSAIRDACKLSKNPLKGLEAMWKQETPREKFQVFYDIGRFGSSTIQLNTLTSLQVGFVGYIPGVI